MNIAQEEEAIKKLPPQKYTIRLLVIAVASVAAALSTVFGILIKGQNDTIDTLRKTVREKNVVIDRQNVAIVTCEQNASKERDAVRKEQVDEAQRRARIADSMLYALTAAERAVKTAIKNEKR